MKVNIFRIFYSLRVIFLYPLVLGNILIREVIGSSFCLSISTFDCFNFHVAVHMEPINVSNAFGIFMMKNEEFASLQLDRPMLHALRVQFFKIFHFYTKIHKQYHSFFIGPLLNNFVEF